MVEITPQKPKIYFVAWRWPLWISLGLFLLSAAVFVGFKIYLAQLETEILNINNQIKAEAAKVNAKDENTVSGLNDSLSAFNGLVSNHSYFSELLRLTSSLTHTRVTFTKFDADKDKNFLQLKGVAQNYTILAKQMVALRENENIKSLEVKGINFGTSGLDFELTIGIDPKVFIKQQP